MVADPIGWGIDSYNALIFPSETIARGIEVIATNGCGIETMSL